MKMLLTILVLAALAMFAPNVLGGPPHGGRGDGHGGGHGGGPRGGGASSAPSHPGGKGISSHGGHGPSGDHVAHARPGGSPGHHPGAPADRPGDRPHKPHGSHYWGVGVDVWPFVPSFEFGPPAYWGPDSPGYAYYDDSYSLTAEVQKALTANGYPCGEIDGVMGPATRSAIARYQVEHKLPVTARVDTALLKSLELVL